MRGLLRAQVILAIALLDLVDACSSNPGSRSASIEGYADSERVRLRGAIDETTQDSQWAEDTVKYYEGRIGKERVDRLAWTVRGSLGPSWVGGWDLSEGSFAKASVWVKQNPDAIIIDVSLREL